MNNEGYKDPTFDEAYGNIKRKERLCKKHGVQIGDTVKIAVMKGDAIEMKPRRKIFKVKIVDVFDKYIVVRYPAGFCESMFWEEFHSACRDAK